MNVGDTVKRTNGASYERGNVGQVLELDAEKQRARINWTLDNDGNPFKYAKPRTWMALRFLVLA